MGKLSKITLKNKVEVTKLCCGHSDEVKELDQAQNFWPSLNKASAEAKVKVGPELYIKWYFSLHCKCFVCKNRRRLSAI